MIDIPPEIVINSTIKPGSVYYFPEDSFQSSEPHYFIVVNKDPVENTVILLVCASSQISKVRKRRGLCPTNTLVEITPAEYTSFTCNSIIDCNSVLETSKSQLVDKLSQNKLQIMISEMDVSLVILLRQGII